MSTNTSTPQEAILKSDTALKFGYRVKITPRYHVQGRMKPDENSQLGSLFVASVELERADAVQFRWTLARIRVRMTFASVAGSEGEGIPDPRIVCVAPKQHVRHTIKNENPIFFMLDRLRIFETLNWLIPAHLRNGGSFGTHMSEDRAVEWDMRLASDEISPQLVAMDLGVILAHPSRSTWKVTIKVQPVVNDYREVGSSMFTALIVICSSIYTWSLICVPICFLLERPATADLWLTFGMLWVLFAGLTLTLFSPFRVIYAFFEVLTKKVEESFTFAADVQRTIPEGVDPENLALLQGRLENFISELQFSNRSTNPGPTVGNMGMTDWMLSKMDDEAVRARRRLYSQRSLPETFQVVLEITWELQECILSDIGSEDSLLDVVTLSGSPDHSVAIKCGEYLQATWGSRGTELFSLLHSQILSDFREAGHIYISRVTKVTFMSSTIKGQISVDLHGYLDDIEAAYQVLTWIVATFRLPKAGKLCSSGVLMRSDFPGEIRIKPNELQEISLGKPGTCWQPLFPSSVIATDFPKLNDPLLMGVNIPFDMMLHLAGTLHHVDLGALSTDQTGVYFKGVHSLLIPVRLQNNGIQWHLVWDEKRTLPPGLIFDYINEWDRSLKLETLTSKSMSHFLGYCASAGVTLGTHSRLALYQHIATSRADMDRPSPEISVNSTQIGLSHMVTGQISSNYKYRNGLVVARGAERQYREVIQSAAVQPVILFETTESQERGWLVPQLSAILDLINWRYSESHVHHIHFTHIVPDGGQAASDVLNNMPYARTVLEAAILDDEKDITIGSKVKDIYAEMSTRSEANATSKRNARFTKELSTERLRGWDFLELLNPGMISYQRQIALHRSDVNPDLRYNPSWLPLAREVPVYFGRHLGELIVPMRDTRVCKDWSPLPGGFKLNYLAATVHCLKNVAESHGYEDCCLVLDELIWNYRSIDVFEDCDDDCMGGSFLCRKRAQQLCKPWKIGWTGRVKRGGLFIPHIPIEGAVVFTNAKSKRNDFIEAFWKFIGWIP